MNSFNPYESPQVELSLNPPKQTDRDFIASILGPDWLEVCKGAQYCMTSIKIGLVAAFFTLLHQLLIGKLYLSIINPFNLYFLISTFVAILSVVIQGVGIQKLRFVSLETETKGYFTIAMFSQRLFWSSLLLYTIYIFVSQFDNVFDDLPYYVVASVILVVIASAAVYHISLFQGLRRIGMLLKNSAVSNSAIAAIIAFGLIMLRGALTLVIDEPDQLENMGVRYRVIANSHIFIFGCYFLMLAAYATALVKISKYANQYRLHNKDEELKTYFDQISDQPESEE